MTPPAAPVRKPHRLTRRAEFLAAARLGRKAATGGLVLQALRRDDDGPGRLGFTVTKKVGNAVVRNRTKRRLREAARLLLRDLADRGEPLRNVDLVLVGRDGTRARTLPALVDDLGRALRRTGIRGGRSPETFAAAAPTVPGPVLPAGER